MVHYDYIEIGTSDFDTICQSSEPGAVGISMEPVAAYLHNLPDKLGNIKIEAALVPKHQASQSIYWLPARAILEYGLPKWLRGCNTLGAPHRSVIEYLKAHGLSESLLDSRHCKCMTPSELVEQYQPGSIGVLKLDTEGMDSILVTAWAELCKGSQAPLPEVVWWECNNLSTLAEIAAAQQSLLDLGYELHHRNSVNCMMMRGFRKGTNILHMLGISGVS